MSPADNTAVPNAARVYDYLLGGTHHYEADRQAAAAMLELLPSTAKWVRRLRKFLQHAVQQLADEGFAHFLDLGSGLPTAQHIHATARGAHVVYVDIDPTVVTRGRESIAGNADAHYLQADIRSVADIVQTELVRTVFRAAPKVAIGLNAVTCFLTERELAHLAQTLHAWAPAGSKLFATYETKVAGAMTPRLQQFLAMFDRLGSPYHFLTLEKSKALMAPWTADEKGYQPLAEWLGLQSEVAPDDDEGVGLEFYGTILSK